MDYEYYNIPDIQQMQTMSNEKLKKISLSPEELKQCKTLQETVELKERKAKEKYLNKLVARISKKIERKAKRGYCFAEVKQYEFDKKSPFYYEQIKSVLRSIFEAEGYQIDVYHCGETFWFYDYLYVKVSWLKGMK